MNLEKKHFPKSPPFFYGILLFFVLAISLAILGFFMFFVIPTSTAVLSLKEEAANSIPFSPDLIATFYFLFFESFLHSFSAAMCLIVAFAWTSIYRKAFPKLLFSIGIVLFASFAVEMICFFFLCFCRIDLLEVRIFFFASLIKALLGTVSFLVGKFHIAFKKNEGEIL